MGKPSKSGYKGTNKETKPNMGGEKTPKFGNGSKFQMTPGKSSGKKS